MRNFYKDKLNWKTRKVFSLLRASFLLFFFSCVSLMAAGRCKEELPPKEGNFKFSYFQQRKALLAFGQNVVPEGTMATYLYVDDFWKSRGYFIDLFPAFLYGIKDDLSVVASLPVTPGLKRDQRKSAGLEDAVLNFEYAYYEGKNSSWIERATIVAGMTFPTGSRVKKPATGYAVPGAFLGGTYNRTYVNWHGFVSAGLLMIPAHKHVNAGDVFLYQGGVSRYFCSIGNNLILEGITEMSGFYSQKNSINGMDDPDSGGNKIFLVPSLRLIAPIFAVQVGMGLPIVQQQNGRQPRDEYYLGGVISYGFPPGD